MVNLSIVNQSSKIANLLNNISIEICDKHEQPLQYYCSTCNNQQPLCIQCYYHNHDITHQLLPLTNAPNHKKISDLVSTVFLLQTSYTNKEQELSLLDNKIELIKQNKDYNITMLTKIQHAFERYCKEIISELLLYKESIVKEMEVIDNEIKQLRNMYYNNDNNGIEENNSKENVNEQINTNLNINAIMKSQLNQIDVCDIYKKRVFVINYNNCRELMNKNVCIINKVIHLDFMKLAIYLYPNGILSGKGNNVSLYLKVLNTFPENTKLEIEFTFEIVSPSKTNDNNKNYSNKTTAIFNKNVCSKGWSCFYPINNLYKNNFFNEKGDLTLKCYVRYINIIDILKYITL